MILAFDVGSSTVKGARFSDRGRCEGLRSVPVAMRAGEGPVAHEIEAADWVAAVRGLAAGLLADGAAPEAVSICGNGPTLLPVDAAGAPLHPALAWMDRRADREAAEVGAAAGAFVDASFPLPKALWFARRRREIYERTAAFLSCPEYLASVLSGERMTVVPAGYEKHYGDGSDLEALGLDAAKFPPRARPGALAGEVSAAGEAATGIPRGAKVVVAGPDFLAAIAGTATIAPGRACDRAGTSEGINLCARAGISDRRLLSVPHIVPPYANISGMISASGMAVDWFRRASGLGGSGYEEFFEEAGRSRPGAGKLVFLPYLSGERAPIWDPRARGVFLGLSLAHGRAEMARAVVEATAFAMRDVIEVMEESGAQVGELRVAGRPGKSDLWNQIKADVTGRPILLPSRFEDAELLGCLCMALAALGRGSLAEAAQEHVGIGKAYEPDEGTRGLYDELFAAYRSAYAALKPVFARLDAAAEGERSGS